MGQTEKKSRRHLPSKLGPRIERRGRWYSADLRPWGGSRYTVLCDPEAPGWPDAGRKTEDLEEATEWSWRYVRRRKDEDERPSKTKAKARLVAAVLDDYDKHRDEEGYEPSTLANTRWTLGWLRDEFGEKPLHKVTSVALQDAFNAWRKEGYKLSTLHTRRATLGAFFVWAKGRNPAAEVKIPAVQVAEDPFAWTDEDVAELRTEADAMDAEHAAPLSMRLVLELGLNLGVRIGELVALRWNDFDEPSATVRVVRQFGLYSKRPKQLKGKNARTALVLPGFSYYRRSLNYCILIDGEPITRRQLDTPFARLLRRADARRQREGRADQHQRLSGTGRHTHDMRRTYGRIFLESGGRLEELQKFLGHASITTTERAYGRFTGQRAAEFARQRLYGAERSRNRSFRHEFRHTEA